MKYSLKNGKLTDAGLDSWDFLPKVADAGKKCLLQHAKSLGMATNGKMKNMKFVAHGLGTVIATELGMAISEDGLYGVEYFFGESNCIRIRYTCITFNNKTCLCDAIGSPVICVENIANRCCWQ